MNIVRLFPLSSVIFSLCFENDWLLFSRGENPGSVRQRAAPLPAFSLTACGGFRGFRTLRRAAMGSGSRLPARSVLLPPAEVSTGHPHPPGTLQPPQRLAKLLQSSAPAFTTVFPLYLVCTAENCNYYLSFLLLLGWRSFLRAFASI